MSIAHQGRKKVEGTRDNPAQQRAATGKGAAETQAPSPNFFDELGQGLTSSAGSSEVVTTEIDVKTAVEVAMAYFTNLYGSLYTDLALEEVEKVDRRGTNKWLVTLGYLPARRSAMAGVFTAAGSPRQYKLITVDAETGEAESMKVAKV